MVGVHDGPGVVPGRYPGEPIPLHPGRTPQQEAVAAERAAADALAGKICAAAAVSARSECELLDLLGEFDASGAIRWWTDVKSLAHWLGWACSMTPGVAREHVRVAKALRRMPTVREAFAAGRLSYSKVREVSRVVDTIDEAKLCALALTATASQLARMVSAYRAAAGTRIGQQTKRTLSWHTRDDGMVAFRAVLPAEEAAVLVAAVGAATDQFGAPPEKREPGAAVGPASSYTPADAILDVARGFLAAAPEDRSGEDRRLVVVHVAADQLGAHPAGNVPAGTSPTPAGQQPEAQEVGAQEDGEQQGAEQISEPDEQADVPAGTSPGSDPTCHVEGVGPIEPETARRLACDATLLGAVVDAHGQVLALGRTRRLVSRAQRRALMIRDRGMCQFPGCHQTRHLDAHHRIPWSEGGATDLDNLLLLCQWHHTCLHEGRMTIRPRPTVAEPAGDGAGVWQFVMPDGTPHRSWYTDDALPHLLTSQLDRRRAEREADDLGQVTSFHDPAAQTIRPGWAGEPFDLHACVEALFGMRLPEAQQEAA